jgi:SAM-dependent methyltransferase
MSNHPPELDAFGEDDFDEDTLASVAVANGAASVSHEFNQYSARGLEASCWSPWRMLKVDIRSRTMVCCNFAQKLPEFEWPTAKEFHRETGMWNHPFMQYMREGMGKSTEVPYCTLCRTKDKRDIKNFDLRKLAMKETQKLFDSIVDNLPFRKLPDSVGAIPEKLKEWSYRLRPGSPPIRPFSQERGYYRRLVRTRKFSGLSRVLQVGARNAAITPFLAERNDQVTVVDNSVGSLVKATGLARGFAIGNVDAVQTRDAGAMPFAGESFDAIWLDGHLLSEVGRHLVLSEAFRLLVPGGRLQVNQCLGSGGLVEAAAAGRVEVDMASDALSKGPLYDGVGAFLSLATVLAAMKFTGFVSDRANPPAATRIGSNAAIRPGDGMDHKSLAIKVREPSFLDAVRSDAAALNGLERFISLSLTKRT